MLFRETVAIYCENHTEHMSRLCGQNGELFEECGTYSYYYDLKN
jgi:hypothetical protein